MQRPRPRVRHVIAAVEAGWEEEPGVPELGAVVDLVADPLAPRRAGGGGERAGVGLDQLAPVVAGEVGAFEHVHVRELDPLADRYGEVARLYAHDVADVAPQVHHRVDLRVGCAVPDRLQREAGHQAGGQQRDRHLRLAGPGATPRPRPRSWMCPPLTATLSGPAEHPEKASLFASRNCGSETGWLPAMRAMVSVTLLCS